MIDITTLISLFRYCPTNDTINYPRDCALVSPAHTTAPLDVELLPYGGDPRCGGSRLVQMPQLMPEKTGGWEGVALGIPTAVDILGAVPLSRPFLEFLSASGRDRPGCLLAGVPPYPSRAIYRRRGETRINSQASTRKAWASRPNTVTLAETAARSIEPRYRTLSLARSANSSWVSFLAWRARRTFVAMASFKSIAKMATIIGTMLPGTIVPIRQICCRGARA